MLVTRKSHSNMSHLCTLRAIILVKQIALGAKLNVKISNKVHKKLFYPLLMLVMQLKILVMKGLPVVCQCLIGKNSGQKNCAKRLLFELRLSCNSSNLKKNFLFCPCFKSLIILIWDGCCMKKSTFYYFESKNNPLSELK